MNDIEKAKHLCNIGVCCSMAEARRIVMQGAFDRWVKRERQNTKEGVALQPTTSPVRKPEEPASANVKPFSASLKAKLRNKSFKKAFEHYSDVLSIGLIIREARKSAGLTQKELAARLGLKQQFISRLERGEEENPIVETLSKIAVVTE